MTFSCRFCGKTYARESTLAVHLCEPKRRHQQQQEQGVQLGYKAYLRFYETTQGSAKLKTYDEFSKSAFYLAFVRFGRYLSDVRCVNAANYTDWLLKNNHKLDYWTKDSLYEQWLFEYIRKEPVQDAIERSLKEMQNYAETDSILQNCFYNYFRLGNSNLICHHISTGRISPWVVYNCSSGITWLDNCSEEQVRKLMIWIDPDFWQRKFQDYLSDTEWCKMILSKAEL